MMPEDLIAALHACPWAGTLCVTGGGAGAVAQLLAAPGASATVLEAIVPYSAASLADWLGGAPPRACDRSVARGMALRSLERSQRLHHPDKNDSARLFGVGCTASLATSREKRGEDRAHIGVQTAAESFAMTLAFERGRLSRAAQEAATSHAVIAALCDTVGLRAIDLSRTPPGIAVEVERYAPPAEWGEVLLGHRAAVAVGQSPAVGTRVCLFPGSFNPPHDGHRRIAEIAAERTGMPVVYELALRNVEKPSLDFLEARRRIESLGGAPVWLTGTPTFVEKAALSPAPVFAVGVDTVLRVADPAYHRGDCRARDAAIAELAARGATFLVFGRMVAGRFEGLDAIDLPDALRAICKGVPEAEFREDVSSTELRRR